MAKKKLKGDGIYFTGTNSCDVTGSEILVIFNGKKILFENGLYQCNSYIESYRVNSQNYKYNPSEIDYVFVGHGHIDHVGKLPLLVSKGFKGKIITSHETAMIIEPLLSNCSYILDSEARCLSKQYDREYKPLYVKDDVYRMLDFVYEYDKSNHVYKLDDTVSFQFFENSHCVGAKQIQVILNDGCGKQIKILYTSDIGGFNANNHFVENTQLVDCFNDYVIMESTYGEKTRINNKTREFDIKKLKCAIETVLERNGKLVLPAFSFSRTQELLTVIYELFHDDKDFKYQVVVDSMLSCEISDLYNEILLGKNKTLWSNVYNWENVKFIKDKEVSQACIKDTKPKICISSSGFCTNGRILSYLTEYLKNSDNMVVFSGYVGNDSSYLSYRIKNYKDHKTISINKKVIPNKADCITLSSFSSHANRNDLLKYGSSVTTNNLILVHGSEKAKLELAEDLRNEISKNNKTHKVTISQKDMVIHF